MINLIAQATEMRAKFVSRQVWNETSNNKRYQIIFDILAKTSGGDPCELFAKAADIAFGLARPDNQGWAYTYDQMQGLFDVAMRLAKLEVFS